MNSFAVLAAADAATGVARCFPALMADGSFAHLPNPFPDDDDDDDERPIGDPDDDEGDDGGDEDEEEDDEEPMQLGELALATHRPAGAPPRGACRIAVP